MPTERPHFFRCRLIPCCPCRVQRRRTPGWTMPPNTVYVGRPSKWGNPYQKPDPFPVEQFEADLWAGRLKITVAEVRRELRGKNLACWCSLKNNCHADVLLRIANA